MPNFENFCFLVIYLNTRVLRAFVLDFECLVFCLVFEFVCILWGYIWENMDKYTFSRFFDMLWMLSKVQTCCVMIPDSTEYLSYASYFI